jgi:putative flippase GtrA
MIDSSLILKFLKFCVVGFSGMIIDFGTTWLLKEKVKVNKYVANSSGFILASSSNYLLNRVWTFNSQDPQIATQYLYFLLISLIGLGISNLAIYILNGRMKCNFYLSKIIAIVVVSLWNFLMNFFYTFN